MSGIYDNISNETDSFIESLLERGGLTIRAISDDALRYEILDKNTGHSIASRTINDENTINFENYEIQFKGKTALDDQFTTERTGSGAGDARNMDSIILQQSTDMDGRFWRFFLIFSSIVASVGATVRSNEQSLDGAEATKEAAVETEAQFSGVNLDSEAALIEFQQAYQASAVFFQQQESCLEH